MVPKFKIYVKVLLGELKTWSTLVPRGKACPENISPLEEPVEDPHPSKAARRLQRVKPLFGYHEPWIRARAFAETPFFTRGS